MSCQGSRTKIDCLDSTGTLLSPAEAYLCIHETHGAESVHSDAEKGGRAFPFYAEPNTAFIKNLAGRVQVGDSRAAVVFFPQLGGKTEGNADSLIRELKHVTRKAIRLL